MTLYIGRRLLQAVVVLWAAYTVSFLVLYALPADPVQLLAGGRRERRRARSSSTRCASSLGLDQPLIVQYFTQLGDALHGDLGTSIVTGRPVTEILGEAIPPTAQIAAAGLRARGGVRGRPRLLRHVHPQPPARRLPVGLPPLGVAIPSFWLGLLLIQWFSFAIPIFPAVGDGGPISIVLPAITLAIPTGAVIAQLLAKSLDTTLREPYIDTAWAKGARRTRRAPAACAAQRGPARADHDGPHRRAAARRARSSPRRSSPAPASAG